MLASINARFPALVRLLREFQPHRRRIAAVLALGLVISAIQPASVKLTQRIIDDLQRGGGTPFLKHVPWLLVVAFTISGLAKYFYGTLRRLLAESVLMRLREQIYERYLYMPLAQLEQRRAGELLAGLQNDLVQVGVGIDTLGSVLKEPFTFLGLIAMAVYCDWQLALATLLVAPAVSWSFSRTGALVKRYSVSNLAQFGDMMALGQETIAGARVVKVFGLEKELFAKFRKIQRDYFTTLRKSIGVQELATPVVELIGACLVAGIVIYGGYRVASGDLTTGRLIAFIIAIGLAQMPIKQLNNCWIKLRGAEAAAERVFAALDEKREEMERSGARRITGLSRGLEFESVVVRYGDKLAVDGVSFQAGVGECVALVGPSGSGKSSLVSLVPRLRDPDGGRLLLDGRDLRELDLAHLRALIGFVTQDTFLFNDTIYENIRFGNPRASRKEIERAAELAHCIDFIARSPRGYDTGIGDRGLSLSGGERQRLAIARAFVKQAPILVLDEATSSLDSRSEALVQDALDELMQGRTTLVVAHRLSTVRRADRILVLERGRVRENGTHDELWSLGGVYRGLYDRQVFTSAPLS